ncbi:hypothetical protein PRIPAC_77294, partial [Pristionchus pacificus]
KFRSYSVILLYLSIVELSTAVASLLVFKKVMSTPFYFINAASGPCHQWESPSVCFVLTNVQLAGTAHYAVMIAFCSCYRYYLVACSRSEPKTTNVLIALILVHLPTIAIYTNYTLRFPLLDGAELDRAMNESHPEYDREAYKEQELLYVTPIDVSAWVASHWIQAAIVPVCIVIVIASVKISRILASVGHLSTKNRRRHADILKGLLCQATLPALYAVAIVAYRTERQRVDNSGEMGHLTAMIASILTFLSPLLTILFTMPYREAINRAIHTGTRAIVESSASDNPSLLVIYTGHLSQVQAAVAMITLLVHDTSYSIVLLYLSIVEITTAVASLLVFKKVMSTSSYSINAASGMCRHWGSPSICFYLSAAQLAGVSHYAVMIAFCSCYRYYVIAYSRKEPRRCNVLLALILVHLPTIAIYVFSCIFPIILVVEGKQCSQANYARAPLLKGEELERAMNTSRPEYDMDKYRDREMLLVTRNDLSSWLASNWIQGVIFPVCLIVVVVSARINKILASVEHMSVNSKRRHEQILRGLLCQASLPALYALAVIMHRGERRRIGRSEEFGHLTPMMASILTALSPLFTIIFTLPYRDALNRVVSSHAAPESATNSQNVNGNPQEVALLHDHPSKSSYLIVLRYMSIVAITMTTSSLMIFRRVLCTTAFSIHAIGGVCRHWGSPRLCIDAVQLAGTAHYAVMIAFCFCYRFYVIAFTRGEPSRRSVLIALVCAHIPTIAIYANFTQSTLLHGTELEQVMNESHPEYDMESHRTEEMLLVARRTLGNWIAANWVQGIFVPVGIVVITSTIGMVRILASVEHMSPKSKRSHSMILKGLLCQALLPLLYGIVVAIYKAEMKMSRNSNDIGHFIPTVCHVTITFEFYLIDSSQLAAVIMAINPSFTIFYTIPNREAISCFCARRRHDMLISAGLSHGRLQTAFTFAMLSSLLHDSCYCGGFALNTLLIALIVTRTPTYLRQVFFNELRKFRHYRELHTQFRCYSIVLLYLSVFEISIATSSLLIHKTGTMRTTDCVINVICGVCRQWDSPHLCFYLNAVQLAGISHYAVMIAFCSCYRYYVIAYTRTEPSIRNVLLSLIFVHSPTIAIYSEKTQFCEVCFAHSRLLEGSELERAMNESFPDYDFSKMRDSELLLVNRRSFATALADHWIQGVIVPVCFVVLVASVKINSILASLDHMSANNKRRHAQILRGLLCQATLPVLYALAVVLHRTENGRAASSAEFSHLTMMIASVSAVMSPIFTLTFTLPYRDALLDSGVVRKKLQHHHWEATDEIMLFHCPTLPLCSRNFNATASLLVYKKLMSTSEYAINVICGVCRRWESPTLCF